MEVLSLNIGEGFGKMIAGVKLWPHLQHEILEKKKSSNQLHCKRFHIIHDKILRQQLHQGKRKLKMTKMLGYLNMVIQGYARPKQAKT